MTIVLTQSEVRELLPMDRCIELVADALTRLSAGEALNPLRHGMWTPQGDGILAMMPGWLGAEEGSAAAFGIKVIAVFPGNHRTGLDSHQGLVVLFDPMNGVPRAIVDGSEITAVRTAAATGVATRCLAREDAGDLAIIGSGVQARTHLEAMLHVRPVRRVRVYSRDEARRRAFADAESVRHGVRVEAVASAREAVDGADLICTVSSARDPVVMGSWVAAGAHLNVVGSSIPTDREIDAEAVLRSRLFVDRRESALAEAGDLLIPMEEGSVTPDHIAGEIGDVLLGRVEGRRTPDEITQFKSLGLAVEDLAAARHVLAEAERRGMGTRVELGGSAHAAP